MTYQVNVTGVPSTGNTVTIVVGASIAVGALAYSGGDSFVGTFSANQTIPNLLATLALAINTGTQTGTTRYAAESSGNALQIYGFGSAPFGNAPHVSVSSTGVAAWVSTNPLPGVAV